MNQRLLTVTEVALYLNCSVYAINLWYAWKKENPAHKYAKLLPKYIQKNSRQIRYWKEEDLWKLVEFKKNIKKGRNGFMGTITQKYYKKKGKNKDE